MLHRVRAQINFPAASGLAVWCHAQMDVRHQQAVHINEGLNNQELKYNTAVGETFTCDLPLLDEAAANDALATLGDHNVLGLSLPIINDIGPVTRDPKPSWVEYHLCDHDEYYHDGCTVINTLYGPHDDSSEPSDEPQPWQEWDGNNDNLYQIGDVVTHDDKTWIATVGNNHWEPGVFGWEEYNTATDMLLR